VLRKLELTPNQVWGLTRADEEWSAELETALTAGRRCDLEHGTNAAYVAGCVCKDAGSTSSYGWAGSCTEAVAGKIGPVMSASPGTVYRVPDDAAVRNSRKMNPYAVGYTGATITDHIATCDCCETDGTASILQ